MSPLTQVARYTDIGEVVGYISIDPFRFGNMGEALGRLC